MMYKCKCCGVQRDCGDEVYFVESAFLNMFVPTCSKECAEKIKQKEIKELKDKIYRIENRGISKERW